MKNLILPLIFISFFMHCPGQEQTNYKTVISKLTSFYNAAQYDSIWQLCSSQMQSALPLEKTREFFGQMKNEYGQIEHNTYYRTEGTMVIYSSKFEKSAFTIRIALDDVNKIAQ